MVKEKSKSMIGVVEGSFFFFGKVEIMQTVLIYLHPWKWKIMKSLYIIYHHQSHSCMTRQLSH